MVLTGVSFLLGFAITSALIEWTNVAAQAAYAVALVICTIANFFGCRHWVFQTTDMPIWPEAWRFFSSVLGFRLLELAVFHVLYASTNDYRIAYVITQTASAIGKFIVAKLFIFRRRSAP